VIRLPRRSVTRFFIPLIDVLTLLFCIFLVLPLAQGPEEAEAAPEALRDRVRELEKEVEQLRRLNAETPQRLREEIQQLRDARGKELEKRLAVRVLEIDGSNGRLYYRDPERVDVADEAAAHDLIEHDRRRLGAGQELYYLILYPRDPNSSYPTRGQRERYDRWFQGVALGYDVPGAGPEKGKQP
jgi:hypothetical protein